MLYQSLFFVVALFFSAVTASVPIPLQSCSSGSDLVTINSATANVWPPIKGQEFTVDLAATLSQAINGGTYELKVVFDSIIPLIDKTGPLTDLNITFPIKAGPITLSKSLQFPNIPISGSVDITIQAKDNNGNEIVCEKISVTLSAPKKQVDAKVTDVPIPYTSCAGSSDLTTLTEVTANAWPPVKGSDLIITVHGTLSKAVNNGTYEIKASFDGIPILDQKGALSALTTLPLAAGAFSVSKTQNLPSIIPSGKIDITITAASDDGTEILCIKVEVSLAKPRPAPIAVPSRVAIKNRFPIIVSPFKVYSNVAVPFKSCGSSGDLFPITAVSATSWPPVSGATIQMTSVFDAKAVINGGTYHYKAEYLGIVVQDKTDTLAAAGYQLPINPGAYTITQSVTAPSGLPPGHITTTTSATDQNGKALFCFVIEFDV